MCQFYALFFLRTKLTVDVDLKMMCFIKFQFLVTAFDLPNDVMRSDVAKWCW